MNIGSNIPNIQLTDQFGQSVNLNSFSGKSKLVVYFYPKDDTPGCTREACSFRDQYEVFKEAGAEIIGISSDTVESHRQFALKHRLPYLLLSDPENMARKQFGVPDDFFGLLPGRVTYIIDKQGIVQYIFTSQFRAGKHLREALAILEKLP